MDNRRKVVFWIILVAGAMFVICGVDLSAQTFSSSSAEFDGNLEAQKVVQLSVAKQGIVRRTVHEPQEAAPR